MDDVPQPCTQDAFEALAIILMAGPPAIIVMRLGAQ
jgi:hypothetical protein